MPEIHPTAIVAPGAMLEGFYRIGHKSSEAVKQPREAKVEEPVKEEAPVVSHEPKPAPVIKIPVRKSVVPIRRH